MALTSITNDSRREVPRWKRVRRAPRSQFERSSVTIRSRNSLRADAHFVCHRCESMLRPRQLLPVACAGCDPANENGAPGQVETRLAVLAATRQNREPRRRKTRRRPPARRRDAVTQNGALAAMTPGRRMRPDTRNFPFRRNSALSVPNLESPRISRLFKTSDRRAINRQDRTEDRTNDGSCK